MKKNKMMRIASILMVAVLLSTCAISGTFAKYVTADSDQDTARVAKWGVTVDVVVDGAFNTEYDADVTANDQQAQAIAKSVVSSTEENLVAPGTNGTLLSKAKITGAPEVAVNIKKVADLVLTGWAVDVTNDGQDNAVYYCPLVINGIKGTDYASADAFEEAVEASLAVNVNCQPNADLAMDTTVAWSWAFTGNDNEKDTALGNLADAPKISFTYTITVEQID